MAPSGTIALMGSGELTASMVEVHKSLIGALPVPGKITFIDTPAGFQPNVDQISAGAVEYFKNRVQQTMEVASYKSPEETSEIEAAKALQKLRESGYILMGPGSPTYTVEQFQHTAITTILAERVKAGACLTAASAAALTMGRYTLPVYEIYKVGQPLHWVKGLDFLALFDLHLVVIPHWNNAEGGTHDTSRCFMGQERFAKLLAKMEQPTPILGLDEHTACIINLADDTFHIRGIGEIVLMHNGQRQSFQSDKRYPLAILRDVGETLSQSIQNAGEDNQTTTGKIDTSPKEGGDFWEKLHDLDVRCQSALADHDDGTAVAALLDLDRLLWEARTTLQNPDVLAEARYLFRELIVLVGTRPRLSRAEVERAVAPAVEHLIEERQRLRREQNWQAADTLREALMKAGITVEDREDGTKWSLQEQQEPSNDQTP